MSFRKRFQNLKLFGEYDKIVRNETKQIYILKPNRFINSNIDIIYYEIALIL